MIGIALKRQRMRKQFELVTTPNKTIKGHTKQDHKKDTCVCCVEDDDVGVGIDRIGGVQYHQTLKKTLPRTN